MRIRACCSPSWLLLLLLTLWVPSCGPRVVHVCPSSMTHCPTTPPRRASSTEPAREPKALFGFARPRAFGLPHTMDSPRSVALDPSGKTLALANQWGEILLVDTATGRARHRLGSLEELADGLRLAFTRDGHRLVSAGHAHTRVRLWDAGSGKLLTEVDVGSFPIQAIAMGPGVEMAAATEKGAEIWNLEKATRVHLATMPYNLPAVSVAGSQVSLWAAGDRAGNVRLFGTGSQRSSGLVPSPGQRVETLALSGDGRVLGTGFENGWIRINDTAALAERSRFRFYTEGPPLGLRLHTDGSRLAVAEPSGKITHLDTTSGEVLASLPPSASGETLDFDINGEAGLIATVSSNRRVSLIQGAPRAPPLSLPPDFEPKPLPRPDPELQLLVPALIEMNTPSIHISALALGRRGQFLAVAGHPTEAGKPAVLNVYYLDFSPRGTGTPVARPLYTHRAPPAPPQQKAQPLWLAITPDRRWLLAQGGGFSMQRWALISGRSIPTLQRSVPPMRGLVPCHDNATLVSQAGREVVGWTLTGVQRFRFPGLDKAYWLGTTPDGPRVVMIRGWDRMAAYDIPSGTRRWENDSGPLPEYEVLAMALPPGTNRLLTYHANGFLRIHDLTSGILLTRHRIPTPAGTARCALRPDGRVLACGHPGGVDLVEVPSGASLGSLSPPSGIQRLRVEQITFSPKGNVLALQVSRNTLALYSFDHPGEAKQYEGVEAEARVRLGLSLVPTPIRQPPSALTAKPIRSPPGLLRPQSHSSPDSKPTATPPTPGTPPPDPAPRP